MNKTLTLLFSFVFFAVFAQHDEAIEKSTLYTIPVVFHVLHQNGYENISFAQIEDAVRILNENYSASNASISTIHSDFQGMQADAQIEFKLAKIAPNGQCFNGVTRTFSTVAGNYGFFDQKVQTMINGNDVFQGIWPENKYLNIFVCNVDVGEATSSFLNGTSGMLNNSIFVLHNYTGSIGTGSFMGTKDFLTTEVGRWLGLNYTFGTKTFLGDPANCLTDDGLMDTPNCVWSSTCNFSENTCGPLAMIENFMALDYCMKFFTSDQVDVMHTTLNNSANSSYELWQPTNLVAVGINNAEQLCSVDFTLDKTYLCNGKSVQFKDASYSNILSWQWSFPGGTPATSTEQNPLIVYDSPGFHDVSLSVSDGVDTLSITKNNVLKVTPVDAVNFTYYEGFEYYSDFDSNGKFGVYNPESNAKFAITTLAAHLGSQSAVLHNFEDTLVNMDALISSRIDYSWISGTQATMSFRYAFRRRANDTIISFKLLKDIDCFNSWGTIKNLTNDIKVFPEVIEDWYPNSSDWQTVHVTNLNLPTNPENFRYKFEFIGGRTNNLFIDDINIYEGAPSDEVVLGMNENNALSLFNLQLFPNPSNGEVNVGFDMMNDEDVVLELYDVLGNKIQSYSIHAMQGGNSVLIDASSFSSGIYLLKVRMNSSEQIVRFVKH